MIDVFCIVKSRNCCLQVTGVVGRAELLSSLCYLAALMTYAKCTGSKTKTGGFFKS